MPRNEKMHAKAAGYYGTAVFTMKHIDDQPTDFICSELKVTDFQFLGYHPSHQIELKGMPAEALVLINVYYELI